MFYLMLYCICFVLFFFFNDTATTEIYTYGHTLSLHDALPILLADEGLPLTGLDLEGAAMEMVVNGTVASTGVGAAALGNPLNAAAWLAQTLAGRGEPLKAGDILLAGALGPMVALKPGDHVHATVSGIGACSFSQLEAACETISPAVLNTRLKE